MAGRPKIAMLFLGNVLSLTVTTISPLTYIFFGGSLNQSIFLDFIILNPNS
jgi:hypothetical protein